MKNILCILCLLFISACNKSIEKPVLSSTPKELYPDTSIIVNNNVDDLITDCSQYGCVQYRDDANSILVEHIQAAKIFKSIERINVGSEYTIFVDYSHKPLGDTAVNLGKAAVMIGTLMLVPTYTDFEYSANFRIYRGSEKDPIAEYKYVTVVEQPYHITEARNSAYRPAAKNIATDFLNDIIKDKVFEK